MKFGSSDEEEEEDDDDDDGSSEDILRLICNIRRQAKDSDAKYVYTYSIFFPHPMSGGMPLSSSMAGFCLTYS
jgi:hypothetical protein